MGKQGIVKSLYLICKLQAETWWMRESVWVWLGLYSPQTLPIVKHHLLQGTPSNLSRNYFINWGAQIQIHEPSGGPSHPNDHSLLANTFPSIGLLQPASE